MGLSVFAASSLPLSELITEAQAHVTDNSTAMNEIVRRFDQLARKIARSVTLCGFLQDDVANAARLALVRAVRGHDPARDGFPAYAELFMRGEARRELHRHVDVRFLPVDDVDLQRLVNGYSVAADTGSGDLWSDNDRLGYVATALTQDQQHLLEDRYAYDTSLKEMAAVRGTSVSAVSQRLTTIRRLLDRVLAA